MLEYENNAVKDEDTPDWDDDDAVCIRAKWIMDGAQTLAEARHKLHAYAKYLEQLEQQGYELIEPIVDDYGFLAQRSSDGTNA